MYSIEAEHNLGPGTSNILDWKARLVCRMDCPFPLKKKDESKKVHFYNMYSISRLNRQCNSIPAMQNNITKTNN